MSTLKQLIRTVRKQDVLQSLQNDKVELPDMAGCFVTLPCLCDGNTLQDCHIRNQLSTPFPSVTVIPDFVSEADEILCSSHVDVYAANKTRNVCLRGRKTQVWGGTVAADGLVNSEPLPQHFRRLASLLVEANIFSSDKTPNHVLINSYERGGGIMPHSDGSAYHPVVAILSLSECLQLTVTLVVDSDRVLSC
eukprot:Lankesteria_metandrocarpae@DN4304_c1_g1_i10.p1